MGNENTPLMKRDRTTLSGNIARLVLFVLLVNSLPSCSQDKKESLKIGDSAPGFTVSDLEGNEISLTDYKGYPVILRFFLTDCKFCRADTPVFNDYYARYGNKGLKIIYIDTLGIDVNVLSAFKKELDITFPVARDTGGTTSMSYKVKALPQTIVLDPQHKIIAAILGGVSEPELNGLLSPFLSPK